MRSRMPGAETASAPGGTTAWNRKPRCEKKKVPPTGTPGGTATVTDVGSLGKKAADAATMRCCCSCTDIF